jgi:hypothetical protein
MATGLNHVREELEFIRRLTDAIVWCRDAGSLLQPATSLRTCKPKHEDLASQHEQVFRVGVERSRRLAASGRRDLPLATDLCGGRLLAYLPDESLADGAAQLESKGFFDTDNIPPYDTWVWMVRNVRAFDYRDGGQGELEANYLVAWVPPDFIALASAGVDANPQECILWLDTLDDEFVQSLKRLKFIT